jgi:hypothetical protein
MNYSNNFSRAGGTNNATIIINANAANNQNRNNNNNNNYNNNNNDNSNKVTNGQNKRPFAEINTSSYSIALEDVQRRRREFQVCLMNECRSATAIGLANCNTQSVQRCFSQYATKYTTLALMTDVKSILSSYLMDGSDLAVKMILPLQIALKLDPNLDWQSAFLYCVRETSANNSVPKVAELYKLLTLNGKTMSSYTLKTALRESKNAQTTIALLNAGARVDTVKEANALFLKATLQENHHLMRAIWRHFEVTDVYTPMLRFLSKLPPSHGTTGCTTFYYLLDCGADSYVFNYQKAFPVLSNATLELATHWLERQVVESKWSDYVTLKEEKLQLLESAELNYPKAIVRHILSDYF